jgi:uncharacterized membrane protein YfcA
VDVKSGCVHVVGFITKSFLGAKFAMGLSSAVVEKVFGAALLVVVLKMIFIK